MIGKEEIKLSLFTDDKIIYIENMREWIKILQQLIIIARLQDSYKDNIKSTTFLYTSNKQIEFEIKNTISFKLELLRRNVFMSHELSYVKLFVTLWTVALQAPLSMGILQARILG